MPITNSVLAEIHENLRRLHAPRVHVRLDRRFEPESGVLLRVEHEGAEWHMFPLDFRNLLGELPDEAGEVAIHEAIEYRVMDLWHGPSPAGSRDTTS